MGSSIVDIQWSPFNSTIFIGLSMDKMYMFDLDKDRYGPIYSNKPVRSKCTNI